MNLFRSSFDEVCPRHGPLNGSTKCRFCDFNTVPPCLSIPAEAFGRTANALPSSFIQGLPQSAQVKSGDSHREKILADPYRKLTEKEFPICS